MTSRTHYVLGDLLYSADQKILFTGLLSLRITDFAWAIELGEVCQDPNYARHTDSPCIVFDIMSEQSFKNFHFWLDIVTTANGTGVQLIAFGNKTDFEDQRQVNVQDAQTFFNENGMENIEGSAKTGANVAVLFERLAETAPHRPVTIATAPVLKNKRRCC
jgi:hypothetical protein